MRLHSTAKQKTRELKTKCTAEATHNANNAGRDQSYQVAVKCCLVVAPLPFPVIPP